MCVCVCVCVCESFIILMKVNELMCFVCLSASVHLSVSYSKTLAKMQSRFFCECIWVKPSCKCRIIRKRHFLLYFRFSVKLIFSGSAAGTFMIKTLRRLDTTWNFTLCHWQKTLTHRVFVMKINHRDCQPSRLRLQWTFPQKTASVPATEGAR